MSAHKYNGVNGSRSETDIGFGLRIRDEHREALGIDRGCRRQSGTRGVGGDLSFKRHFGKDGRPSRRQ